MGPLSGELILKFMLKSQGRLLTPSVLLGTIIWATIVLTASADLTNCAPPPPGLAGWWAGDGNAQDNLGGNNGALYGSMGFGTGKVGQAFNFDGSSGYVEMPASASLNVGVGAGLTFECWIKPAALVDAQPVAEWNSGAHFGLHLWISQPPPYGGGPGSLYVNLVDTAGTAHTLTTGGGILNTNGFQHVALSYDKASGMASLYYNGALVAAGTLGSFTPQTSFGLYLGKRVSDAQSAAFHGLMDEASLYSRVLTAAEIQAIYKADGAGKCSLGTAPSITAQPASQTVLAGATATFSVVAAGSSPLSYQWRRNGTNLSGANGPALTLANVQLAQSGSYTVQVTNRYGSATSSNAVLTVNPVLSCAPPPAGLIGWWRAEGSAADAVGGHNGTPTNGVGFDSGRVGLAFRFNGTNSYVQVADSPSLRLTNELTIEFWVKRQDLNANDVIINKGGDRTGNSANYGVAISSLQTDIGSKLGFIFAGGTRCSAGILDLNWHHVAVVARDGDVDATIYVDGVQQPIIIRQGPATISLYPSTWPLTIGAQIDPASGWYYYSQAIVDELSLYNRALTATEIQAIYSADGAGKCSSGTAPSITVQPTNQVASVGGSLSFTVAAAGTAPLSYQWRFAGTNLAGATSTALTLTNLQMAQAGSYTVQVTNLYGSATSSNAVLTVNPVLSCVPPPSGLVSWWAAEGTVADAAGTNNGVLFGAGFGAGEVGQAFTFDGSTQAVFIPYTRSLLTTNYSVEAWVKPLTQVSDPGNQEQIMGQAGGWQLVVRPGASGVSVAFLFATSTGGFPAVVSTSELPLEQFSHVVGSWDGTTLRLYINGVLNAQAVPGGTPVDSGRELHIGGSRDGSTPVQCFHGLIDEASYYNRALSAAEIQTLYAAGSAGKCQAPVPPSIQVAPQNQAVPPGGTVSFSVVAGGTSPLSYQWHLNGAGIAGATSSMVTLTNAQLANVGTYDVTVTNLYGSVKSAGATLTLLGSGACMPPPAGLVSWWKAEGTAADVVGTNHGVLFGAGFGAGMVGQAFSFDGSAQAVFIPYTRSLLTTNYSAEAWVKPLSQVSDPGNQEQIMGQAGGWQLVVRPGGSGVSVAFLFATSTGSFPAVVSTSELPIGQFSHVVGSWDGTTLRLYINGVLSAQAVPGATPVDSGRELHIGGSRDGSSPVQCFHSLIDEASYYNRALSASEVQTLYAAGSMGKCQTSVSPSIQAGPQNQAVPPGGTVSFTVIAAGTSPLSYQWSFNGAGIAGATSSALVLTNVQLANVGTYAVTVTNLYGSTNSAGATLTLLGSGACTPPPVGLVSWWAAEGDALDLVGTNRGVLFGAGFSAGEVGQAFTFDGATQAVFIPYTRSLLTTNYSVEAWVKPLTQVSDPINQEQIMGQAGGWQLVVRPGASGVSVAFLFATSTGGFPAAVSTSELPLGQFSHVVGSWDGTTLRLYINGVLNAQAVPGRAPVDSGRELHIGGSRDGSTPVQCFHGLIDEASYYNRALSASEIQTLYAAGSAGKCQTPVPPSIQALSQDQAVPPGATVSFTVIAAGTSPLSYQWHFNGAGITGATSSMLTLTNVQLASVGTYAVTVTNLYGSANSAGATLTLLGSGACTPAPAGLVSWWKAEGTAADVVGTNNGVLFGAGFGVGMVGQAFSFEGATQAVFIPYTRSLLTTSYSAEAWVKPLTQVSDPINQEQIIGQAGGWQLVVRPGASGVSVAFLFATSTGGFPGVVSTSELPIGQFSHVVGSWDGTTLRLYINGALNAQAVPGATPVDSGRELHIGGSRDGSTPVQCFHGLIDEASYYSRALSASEIQAIYNAGNVGKCPVGVAPSILTQPASQAVSAGGNAAFSVTAAGTPPLGYQWQFSGTNIPGATGTSLTLSNVQSAQAGSYAVRVTNAFGSIMSSNALLTVISSPTCATPPPGLVSWWRAEGSASDGVDSNNGTLLNGASFASGMVGQAFSFNGSNQCVQVPHATSLVASNYTIETWVKPLAQVSDAINQDLIFGQSFGHCQLVARTGSSGVRLAFSFGTSHTSFYEATGTSEIPIGQFSHLAGTWDGTTLRLYINGVLNAQNTPHASPVDSGCSFYLGGFYSPTDDSCGYVGQFFNGLIDEASYYNRALSSAEVQFIYSAGGAGKCPLGVAPTIIRQPASQAVSVGGNAAFSVTVAGTPPLSYQWQFSGTNIAGATGTSLTLSNVQSAQAGSYAVRVTNAFGSIMSSNALLTVIAPPCAAAPSGLVSWWRAEGSASDGVDSNNGTLLNGASFASGMVGQAFSFNGNDQCVQVPHAASLVASNYSIEAWIKPLAQVSDPIDQDLIFGQTFGHCQLVARTGSSGVRLAFAFGTSHYSFYEATGTSEIPIGRFSHLAGTWDGTTLRLYINGVLNAQSTPHAAPVDSGCPFYLGGFYSPTDDSCVYVGQFFNGLIDEASYYNRALSGAEIQAIYNAGDAGKCSLGVTPTITRQPASLAVHAGATAVFSVTAAGTPPLSYQWQFRGTSIAGATRTSLTLSNVQAVQAGSYAVRVTNTFGSIISSNALLMVNRIIRLHLGLNPDGTTRVQFAGNSGQTYRIEVSSDMVKWLSLGICTADAEGNVEFSDPNVAKQPLGFYRAVEQ